MKLKEIKPGMNILCETEEEKSALLEELERLGYVWYNSKEKPTEKRYTNIGNVIHVYNDNGYKHITHGMDMEDITHDFSDLIIPEMTAEEALEILSDIRNCTGRECDECPLSRKYNQRTICVPNGVNVIDSKKIMKILQQWKYDHEKKEPETEWVFKCVADIVCCNEIEFFVSEEAAREWCERRTLETGNNHAYVPVCRVKAVE